MSIVSSCLKGLCQQGLYPNAMIFAITVAENLLISMKKWGSQSGSSTKLSLAIRAMITTDVDRLKLL
jgi:hypothetical protein